MTESTLEKLLGRPLTQIEKDNQYLKIAIAQLENLVCMNLAYETEDRVFDVREGYQTVFTDPFAAINSIDVTDYEVRQWDRRNADWYNSVIVDTHNSTVTINADWGICSPELQQLVVKMFGMLTFSKSGGVKSKEIEDYRVTYNDNTEYQQFLLDNAQTINKYSLCNIGQIRSGDVCLR